MHKQHPLLCSFPVFYFLLKKKVCAICRCYHFCRSVSRLLHVFVTFAQCELAITRTGRQWQNCQVWCPTQGCPVLMLPLSESASDMWSEKYTL